MNNKYFPSYFKICFIVFLCCFGSQKDVFSQSVSLNLPVYGDYMRRQQLMGNLSGESSFMIRPLYPTEVFDTSNGLDLDESFTDEDLSEFNFSTKDNKGRFQILPLMFRGQHNSAYGFGINDGPMIPNRGMQYLFNAGVFFEYGPLSIQFQPEILHATNQYFQGFPLDHWGSTWLQYYEWLNTVDIPERFGGSPYTQLGLGQSSIRLNIREFSLGISNENLWWGPGRRASLLMSNNAPGFLHLTLNTRKPVQTAIGSFEGQLIAGKLQASGFEPPHHNYVHANTPLYVPKRPDEDWRYLSGLVLTYQPKWLPGLFLGFSSVSQMYHTDQENLADYLPVFNGEKGPESISRPAADQRNQLSAGYFRWMDANGHFEFYGEYGSNGNSRSLSDFLINPDKNRAFSFGFTNLIPLKREEEFFQIGMEMTQTGQTIREVILARNSWYTHPHVRHGYTHKGQVLGFGYGPGSNVISLDASWVKNFNRLGFQLEYINHNNDFYYKRFEEIKDWRRKYVDIVPSILAEWRFNNLLVSGTFQYVSTLNYKWYLENHPEIYFVPGLDQNTFVANIGVSYLIR
ncbi:capsule assembly Wzi family protein [Cyclobacterium sp. SYSU L10401]|uniref:capsule assembly Wzi family protein n=1 Tax=Cyclobacterium sp. SYSU L10401 TaxID=2678657 RepID=UPI0013D7FD96|nr:capsule assembly Wzi family protein [Cyclobacterium sp. SYSU L10401]